MQYWPDIDQNIHIDMFLLETTEERLYAFYCIRKVKLSNEKVITANFIFKYKIVSILGQITKKVIIFYEPSKEKILNILKTKN